MLRTIRMSYMHALLANSAGQSAISHEPYGLCIADKVKSPEPFHSLQQLPAGPHDLIGRLISLPMLEAKIAAYSRHHDLVMGW